VSEEFQPPPQQDWSASHLDSRLHAANWRFPHNQVPCLPNHSWSSESLGNSVEDGFHQTPLNLEMDELRDLRSILVSNVASRVLL